MRPYIDVADEAVAEELSVWESTELKREITLLLDKANDATLQKVLKLLKK